MIKEFKINQIINLAEASGVIFLPKPITIKGHRCNIINKHGIMENVCGDWCLVATFFDVDEDVPKITDEELETIYDAVTKWAKNILSYGKKDIHSTEQF